MSFLQPSTNLNGFFLSKKNFIFRFHPLPCKKMILNTIFLHPIPSSYHSFNYLFAGTLEIGEYDQSDWGAPCEQCLFTFCKKTVMNIFIKGKSYEEIKYFGDGPNDLHPAQALSGKDKVEKI